MISSFNKAWLIQASAAYSWADVPISADPSKQRVGKADLFRAPREPCSVWVRHKIVRHQLRDQERIIQGGGVIGNRHYALVWLSTIQCATQAVLMVNFDVGACSLEEYFTSGHHGVQPERGSPPVLVYVLRPVLVVGKAWRSFSFSIISGVSTNRIGHDAITEDLLRSSQARAFAPFSASRNPYAEKKGGKLHRHTCFGIIHVQLYAGIVPGIKGYHGGNVLQKKTNQMC